MCPFSTTYSHMTFEGEFQWSLKKKKNSWVTSCVMMRDGGRVQIPATYLCPSPSGRVDYAFPWRSESLVWVQTVGELWRRFPSADRQSPSRCQIWFTHRDSAESEHVGSYRRLFISIYQLYFLKKKIENIWGSCQILANNKIWDLQPMRSIINQLSNDQVMMEK